MKKLSWKKLMSLILVAALVIGVLHFGNTKASAEDTYPSATGKSEFAEGSEEGDLTPSIQFEVTHTPGKTTTDSDVKVYFLFDISSSMVIYDANGNSTYNGRTGKYDKSKSRLEDAKNAAESFVSTLAEAGYTDIQFIGFNDKVTPATKNTPTEQIEELYDAAKSDTHGTYLANAVDKAVQMIGDNTGKSFVVIVSDGDPWPDSQDPKDEIKAAVESGIKFYAIDFTFTSNGCLADVNALLSANNADELKNALDEVAHLITTSYANAWITATIGKYVEYVGDEDYFVEGADGKRTWTIPAYVEDVTGKDNKQVSEALPFVISIDGLKSTDGETEADQAVNKQIIDLLLAEDDDEIKVKKEGNNLLITVAITSDATLYYNYTGYTGDKPIEQSLDTQLTAAIKITVPVPQVDWTVNYVIAGQEGTIGTATITKDYDVNLTVNDVDVKTIDKFDTDNVKYDPNDYAVSFTANDINVQTHTATVTYTKIADKVWTVKYYVDDEYQADKDGTITRKHNEDDVDVDFVKNDYDDLLGIADLVDGASELDYSEPDVEAKEGNVFEVNYSKVPETVWSLEYFIYDPEKDENVQVGTTHPEFRRTSPSTEASIIAEFEKDNSFKLSDAPSDYKDDDYRLVSHSVDKNDHVFMVIFAAKDVLTVTYKIEGQNDKVVSRPLEIDEQVNLTEKDLLKVSDIYKDLIDDCFEMTSFTQDSDFAYTVVYKLLEEEYEVEYYVDNTQVRRYTGIFVKYDPKTGKADLNLDEYRKPVSAFGYANDDYNGPFGPFERTNDDKTVTIYRFDYTKKSSEPLPPPPEDPEEPDPTASPTPSPTPDPTPIPTPDPTPIPTPDPTPTPEPEIDVEETETPEGDVEIDEPETPEGAPEEDIEVEPIETPQGDLPQTGVTPAPVFFGIGAACVVFGGMIVIRLRRKEDM